MKKIHTYFYLLLLFANFTQFNKASQESTATDYSTYSQEQLNNAFIESIEKNRPCDLKDLIHAGADMNQSITYWETVGSGEGCCDWLEEDSVLYYAAKHGYIDIVKIMLKAQYSIDNDKSELKEIKDNTKTVFSTVYATIMGLLTPPQEPCAEVHYAFLVAASNGHLDIVQEFFKISGININYVDTSLNTALIYAAKKGHVSVVKELIQAKCNLNNVNSSGYTALMEALSNTKYPGGPGKSCYSTFSSYELIVQALISAKANINKANKFGNTALITAIEHQRIDIIQTLLKTSGIKINHANNEGNTALIIAIKNIKTTYCKGSQEQYDECVNSQKIAEILIQTPGVNAHHANKKGDTAIALLDKYNNPTKY